MLWSRFSWHEWSYLYSYVDFADFAEVPDPSPAFEPPLSTVTTGAQAAFPTSTSKVIYTKWYRLWERTTPQDFYKEAIILPFILLVVGLHVWGRRKNRDKARKWLVAHAPILEQEFAVVGFAGRKSPNMEEMQNTSLTEVLSSSGTSIPDDLLKEKTAQEFATYATGRQNIAFADIKLSLYKRYNPTTWLIEWLASFFFDSARPPAERMEATTHAFDGKEKDLVPARNKQDQESLDSRARGAQSTYDGFVWAVVHKDGMRNLRDDRYDLSLTSTKDHNKLPAWATTMSESAEITDSLLTPELAKAIESAGDSFEYLIITDQPLEKPQK